MTKKTKNKINFLFQAFVIGATAYIFLLGFSAIQTIPSVIVEFWIGVFLIAVMLKVLVDISQFEMRK